MFIPLLLLKVFLVMMVKLKIMVSLSIFISFFLNFLLKISFCYVDFDFIADNLTLFLTETIGKRCSNEADSTTNR